MMGAPILPACSAMHEFMKNLNEFIAFIIKRILIFRMEIVMLMPRLIPLRIQKDRKGIIPPFRDLEIHFIP